MFEKEAEEYQIRKHHQRLYGHKPVVMKELNTTYKDGYNDGYNKANEEHKEKCKTAYIKGIRTMANALKDYDRTDGVWTDYFEHTVEEVLKRLLKENE